MAESAAVARLDSVTTTELSAHQIIIAALSAHGEAGLDGFVRDEDAGCWLARCPVCKADQNDPWGIWRPVVIADEGYVQCTANDCSPAQIVFGLIRREEPTHGLGEVR
jgi:hypothetical protein